MPRDIKRYANRKLYDTEEGCYVSLKDVAELVREGERVRVIDNETGEDLTQQTLTQIILEEGRRGQGLIPTDVLHDLLRQGQSAVGSGWEQLEHLSEGASGLVQRSLGRLNSLLRSGTATSDEIDQLQNQVERLESLLTQVLEESESQEANDLS